jgi:hypothetical protein
MPAVPVDRTLPVGNRGQRRDGRHHHRLNTAPYVED